MPPHGPPARFVRSTVSYDRWHWPTNYVWIPAEDDELLWPSCPTGVGFSTCEAALDAWESYLGAARTVPLPNAIKSPDGRDAYARLPLFASLHGLPDHQPVTVGVMRHRLESLRVEWRVPDGVQLTWTRCGDQIVVVLPVQYRTVALVETNETQDGGWSRKLVDYQGMTAWSDIRDRGWRCSPNCEKVVQHWGDTAPILRRDLVQDQRNAAKAEGWTQGQLALEKVLALVDENALEFRPRRDQ
jgi:hypothetical protein